MKKKAKVKKEMTKMMTMTTTTMMMMTRMKTKETSRGTSKLSLTLSLLPQAITWAQLTEKLYQVLEMSKEIVCLGRSQLPKSPKKKACPNPKLKPRSNSQRVRNQLKRRRRPIVKARNRMSDVV